MENLAYLAFWAYNSCVLLHHLRADEALQETCDELGLLAILEELINAIHGMSSTISTSSMGR